MNSEVVHSSLPKQKKVVFRPHPTKLGKVQNHDKPVHLKNCGFYDLNTQMKIEDVHNVHDYELYLQSIPTVQLQEGEYHNKVPSSILDEWKNLFDSRAEMVRESTQHFWKNYKQYAFGCDELAPVTKQCKNNWGGVGMTLIDSLDTLWIMDLKEEFFEAVDYVG